MKFEVDWIDVLAYTMMIVSIIIGVYLYYQSQVNVCTSSPLVYGAKQMEERIGYPFQGYGYFLLPINYRPIKVTFDSENLTIDSD